MVAAGGKALLPEHRRQGRLHALPGDNIESVQLGTAAELLRQATETLGDEHARPENMQLLAKDLTGALRDVLRVATSPGHLLPVSESHRI